MTKALDLAGKKFDRLFVLERVPNNKFGQSRWRCRCDCGNETEVNGAMLSGYRIRSCGCLIREGLSERRFKHGRSNTPEFRAWAGMRKRCMSPADKMYYRYGGRGIKVCKRWSEFTNFYTDMGPRPSELHTIERRNNDKDYGPKNCYWATRKEQSRNRGDFIRWVTYQGQRVPFSVAVEMAGNKVKRRTALARFHNGWSVKEAVETPVD